MNGQRSEASRRTATLDIRSVRQQAGEGIPGGHWQDPVEKYTEIIIEK
jgi:hypothetical protein